MRITTLLAVAVVAGMAAVPKTAHAQVVGSVSVGVRTGNALSISAYSEQEHGDWHRNYRRWQPVTLYEYDGHYYRHQVRDDHRRNVGRPVSMYRYRNGYFTPPTDQEWNNRHGNRNRR